MTTQSVGITVGVAGTRDQPSDLAQTSSTFYLTMIASVELGTLTSVALNFKVSINIQCVQHFGPTTSIRSFLEIFRIIFSQKIENQKWPNSEPGQKFWTHCTKHPLPSLSSSVYQSNNCIFENPLIRKSKNVDSDPSNKDLRNARIFYPKIQENICNGSRPVRTASSGSERCFCKDCWFCKCRLYECNGSLRSRPCIHRSTRWFFLKNVNYQFFNDQGSAKATGPTGLQQRFNKGSSVILCRFGDFHDIFAKPPCSYWFRRYNERCFRMVATCIRQCLKMKKRRLWIFIY